MSAMSEEAYIDVNERLVWSRDKLHKMRLRMFILGTVAGVVIALLGDTPLEIWGGWAAAAVFFAFSFHEIYWLMKPDAALVELLPQGIIMRTTTEDFIIPWNEIKSVDSIDIHATVGRRREFYPGVTAVLVSKHFYDRVIHVGSFIMRGPGWDAHFVPKGETMTHVALHHALIPASAEEIKRQVEARWKAFGARALNS
jgi:hypothetical protein